MICEITMATAIWLEAGKSYAFIEDGKKGDCPSNIIVRLANSNEKETDLIHIGSVKYSIKIQTIAIKDNYLAFQVLDTETPASWEKHWFDFDPVLYRRNWWYSIK